MCLLFYFQVISSSVCVTIPFEPVIRTLSRQETRLTRRSLPRSCNYIRTTLRIPHAGSRFNTERQHLRFASKAGSLSLWTRGQQPGVILVGERIAPAMTRLVESVFLLLASGTVKKVIEINKFLLGTMAGGAGKSFLK